MPPHVVAIIAARCRELLGDEADTLASEDIELIRQTPRRPRAD